MHLDAHAIISEIKILAICRQFFLTILRLQFYAQECSTLEETMITDGGSNELARSYLQNCRADNSTST